MALVDLEKAYGTVWITGLLHKLIVLKMPEYLLFVLRSYLEGRSDTVHINDARSTPICPQPGYLKVQFYLPFSSPSITLISHTHLIPNWPYMHMILPFYLNPGDLKPSHADSILPCRNYSDTLINGNSG
jgi:hypothetical protein